MSIGARWREARESAGLSAAKAALAAGVHENTIYLLESDKKNDGVTIRVCKQVADIYGVTLGAIFCDHGSERVPSELRPMQELLTPLDMEARISFVRNVVSNAKFMAQLVSVREVDHPTVSANAAYTPSLKSNGTDEAVPPVAWNNVKPPAHEGQNARDSAEAASPSGSQGRRAAKPEKKR